MMNHVIVFLNGVRGISVIETIHKSKHEIIAVVTPSNTSDEISKTIKNLKVSHLCFEKINTEESIAQLKKFDPELFIVAGYSTILKQKVLDIPQLGTINLHAGRLPEYRGGSPLNWQLINGEEKAGISVILMDEGIDTGNIIHQARAKIRPFDNPHQIGNRLIKNMTKDFINLIVNFNLVEPKDSAINYLGKTYKNKDATDALTLKLYENFDNDAVDKYLKSETELHKKFPIIEFKGITFR